MKISNLNKSMCEELFGGKLDVVDEDQGVKSHIRQKQELLEVRRGGTRCWVLHKETTVLPLNRTRG